MSKFSSLTPCISRPSDLLAKKYTLYPLSTVFCGLRFHWLNIFQSTIHSRETWSAFFFYRNFINRNDCICLLNIPVTTSSTKDLESWNDQKGIEFWNCTLLVKVAHLRLKSGTPQWFYHLTPTPKRDLLLFMNGKQRRNRGLHFLGNWKGREGLDIHSAFHLYSLSSRC